MNKAKMQIAATIIKESALDFLAAKHGLTYEQVEAEIAAGNPRAIEQFAALVRRAVDEAVELAEQGKISFN